MHNDDIHVPISFDSRLKKTQRSIILYFVGISYDFQKKKWIQRRQNNSIEVATDEWLRLNLTLVYISFFARHRKKGDGVKSVQNNMDNNFGFF